MSQIILTVVSWAITTILGAVATYFAAKWRAERKRKREEKVAQEAHEDAQTQGMRSILRGEIIRSHDKYIERGYCPIYAKEALQSQYDAYHRLGGNGVITKLFHAVMELPVQPPSTLSTTSRSSSRTTQTSQKAKKKNGGHHNDEQRNN